MVEATQNSETPTVFFSYSRADKEIAVPIIDALKRAGFNVWYDGMLDPGVKYLEKTESVLVNARAVVVLWSPRSIESNWVRDESMIGRDHENLIPLSIEGALPPLGFRQFQATDFSNWKQQDDAPEMQALIRQLAIMHDRPAPPLPPSVQSKKPLLSRRQIIAVGAGAALIGGVGVATQLFRPAPSAALNQNGVVVLSFENGIDDKTLDYLPIGISSDLRSALMRNAALQVVAQRTSDALQQRGLDPVAIAKELGVSFVLDGSLRRTGTQDSLEIVLIDGTTGFSRWTKTYAADPTKLLLLQEDILTNVLRAISENLKDTTDVLGAPTNPAAYDQYLRGIDAWRRAAIPDEGRRALTYFDEAVRLDPSFAAAHAVRGLILSWLSSSSATTAESQALLGEAVNAAERAIQHGPDLADAHSTLGWVQFFSAVNISAAEPPFEQSYQLGQGNAAIMARYATYAALVGKHAKASEAVAQAIRLDPINPYLRNADAIAAYYAGDYARAENSARAALDIDEKIGTVWYRLALAKILSGAPSSALSAIANESNKDLKLTAEALAYANLGQPDAARAQLAALRDAYGEGSAFQQAQILAQLGDLDAAMETLNTAYAKRDPGLVATFVDPMLSPLRDRADFAHLLSQIGFSNT